MRRAPFFLGDVPAILSLKDPAKNKIQAVVLAYRIYNFFRHEGKDHVELLKKTHDRDTLHANLLEVACAMHRHHF